jgi:hypothetical protein
MAGAAVDDPSRHFATVDFHIAKDLFDHLVGATEQRERYGETERHVAIMAGKKPTSAQSHR